MAGACCDFASMQQLRQTIAHATCLFHMAVAGNLSVHIHCSVNTFVMSALWLPHVCHCKPVG